MKERGKNSLGENTEEKELGIGKYYLARKTFFTKSEIIFFNILEKENNGKYTILSKARLEDIVSVVKGLEYKERQKSRGYIKSRHLDFVLLEDNKIKCAIELDGYSHGSKKQQHSDQIKDEILKACDINFYRIKIGEDFESEIKKIIIN